jgi:hypothetical protein
VANWEILLRRPELFQVAGCRVEGTRLAIVERSAPGYNVQSKVMPVGRLAEHRASMASPAKNSCYAHLAEIGDALAVSLRSLAAFWVAYYWPFVSSVQPIQQGIHPENKQDISFRPALTKLRQAWENMISSESLASDGFFLVSEFRSAHHHYQYPIPLIEASQLNIVCIPGTLANEKCIVVDAELWSSFTELSLWIEALCIHEWSIFTEGITGLNRGMIYTLLTDRPDNRRPLTWERNQIEILMMEGRIFECPWTGRKLMVQNYDLDHLLPLSVYPINELWNLVPADPGFNRNKKRDRLPGHSALQTARPRIATAYLHYTNSKALSDVLQQDALTRFNGQINPSDIPGSLAYCATHFIEIITSSRNLVTF